MSEMILAHPITGLVITRSVKNFWKDIKPKQEKLIWIIGITSAVLPDFDLAYALLTNQNSHHHFITHTPIFYLLIGLIGATTLFIIEKINLKLKNDKDFVYEKFKPKLMLKIQKIRPSQILFAEQLIILFIANTITHILMDIPAGKLHPFWPIYDETISILNFDTTGDWISTYIKSPAVFLELFWFIIGIIIILINRKKEGFKTAIGITTLWTIIAITSALILVWYK